MSDLNYIKNMHKKRADICDRLTKDLPYLDVGATGSPTPGKLEFIEFKDLDTWSVRDIMEKRYGGKSEGLYQLGLKIKNMIERGHTINVEPMLQRIVNKGIKKIQKRHTTAFPSMTKTSWVGTGHFRTPSGRVITLTEKEIEALKKYFKL